MVNFGNGDLVYFFISPPMVRSANPTKNSPRKLSAISGQLSAKPPVLRQLPVTAGFTVENSFQIPLNPILFT
jgi:hypothetical protein